MALRLLPLPRLSCFPQVQLLPSSLGDSGVGEQLQRLGADTVENYGSLGLVGFADLLLMLTKVPWKNLLPQAVADDLVVGRLGEQERELELPAHARDVRFEV